MWITQRYKGEKMKKKLMMIAVAIFATVIFVQNVYATDIIFGTVVDCTADDVLAQNDGTKGTPKITGDNANVTVTYDNLVLKKIAAGSSGAATGRPDNKSWVGVKITEPTGIDDGITKATWSVDDSDLGKYEKDPVTENYTVFVPIDEEALERGAKSADGYLTYVVKIDWDGTETEGGIQTITFKILVKNTTLYEKDQDNGNAGTLTWDEAKYEEVIEEMKAANQSTPTEEEQNPDTSDINILFLLGMFAIGGCGIIYSIRINCKLN